MPIYLKSKDLKEELKKCQDVLEDMIQTEFGNRLNNLLEEDKNTQILEFKKTHGGMACSRRLAEMLMKIPTNYAKKPNFSGYSFVDDMISDAQSELILMQWWKFDLSMGTSPLGYFTQCVHYRFITMLNKEKKSRDGKMKLRRLQGLDDPYNEQAKQDVERAMRSHSVPEEPKKEK